MEENENRLKRCELFLFDMDGTIYLGDQVFPSAVSLMETLSRSGRRYLYLTNNSSRSGADYVTRLTGMGFPCTMENIFTSGMATGEYLQSRYPHSRVYLVGTLAFRTELERYGVTLVEEDADVVVAGFDTELVYEKLVKACHFLRRGAVFLAANPDWVCPMPNDEVLPDCGSICALLTAATGVQPLYMGKPNRTMVDTVSRMTGVPNDKICCVGDRLYTDIAVAQNAGAVSVCVLSGETTQEMIARTQRKPDYVLRDVSELDQILKN